MGYLSKPRVFGMTNAQRTGQAWDGGTAGVIPAGVYVYTTDTTPIRFYVGDGSTVGGVLIGPAPDGVSSDKRVIFNDGGAWGSDARLNYDKTTNTLTADQINVGQRLGLNGVMTETISSTTPFTLTTATTKTIVRTSISTASGNIAAITAPSGGIIDGRVIILHNIGTGVLNLLSEYTSGTNAADRITLPGNIAVPAGECIMLYYDNTTSRWRQLAQTRTGPHYHNAAADGGFIPMGLHYQPAANCTASDKRYLGYVSAAVTVTRVIAAVTGGLQVDFNICHSTDYSDASPNKVFTSDERADSTTGEVFTGAALTGDKTIPAGSFIWLTNATPAATAGRLQVSFEFTTDYV